MNEIKKQIDEMIKTLKSIEFQIRCLAGAQRNEKRYVLHSQLEEARQMIIESIGNLQDSERVLVVYEWEE